MFLLCNGKPCFTARPVLLPLLLLSDALINAWIMCPLHTWQLCEACWLMPTDAWGRILRTFLFCLYKIVCVSEGKGDYSKAVIVSLAWVLAQAEKLPQASLQEEYFIALEFCLFCHAGWSWNKYRKMLRKENNTENANLTFILFSNSSNAFGIYHHVWGQHLSWLTIWCFSSTEKTFPKYISLTISRK